MSELLLGYYDLKFSKENLENNYVSVPGWIEQYKDSVTIVTFNSDRILPVVTVPDKPLLYELYTWTTYTDESLKTKIGEISYNALYPDNGSGFITDKGIQEFNVLSSCGIYHYVNKVVMDFTTPPIRTISFINQ